MRRRTFDLVLPLPVLDFTTVLGQGPLKVHGPRRACHLPTGDRSASGTKGGRMPAITNRGNGRPQGRRAATTMKPREPDSRLVLAMRVVLWGVISRPQVRPTTTAGCAARPGHPLRTGGIKTSWSRSSRRSSRAALSEPVVTAEADVDQCVIEAADRSEPLAVLGMDPMAERVADHVSAITRACQAFARRSKPSAPPGGLVTVCMFQRWQAAVDAVPLTGVALVGTCSAASEGVIMG
jgi:hypothetical protein